MNYKHTKKYIICEVIVMNFSQEDEMCRPVVGGLQKRHDSIKHFKAQEIIQRHFCCCDDNIGG